jgi:predicted nucleic acid-binding protein
MTDKSVPFILDNDVFFAAIYEGHYAHPTARSWLDEVKPAGWGIAMETHLAAMRLLMNPAILGKSSFDGKLAHKAVTTELGGPYPGKLLFSKLPPDPDIFSKAVGHRQVMDFWLVQIARDHGSRLATSDQALHRHWPQWTLLVS